MVKIYLHLKYSAYIENKRCSGLRQGLQGNTFAGCRSLLVDLGILKNRPSQIVSLSKNLGVTDLHNFSRYCLLVQDSIKNDWRITLGSIPLAEIVFV